LIIIVTYDSTKKDLPVEQLYHLFYSVGWTGSEDSPDPDMLRYFNVPFINSTLVISAWDNDRLIGAVRVLSDKVIRSAIYDLVVDPEYQSKGIGNELVKRCIEHFPTTEWLVQTENHISGFYEKIGFKIYNDVVLTIPSIYQGTKDNN
jgi:ribosomal protein S18 acetylase RimI-like enzyme